MKIKILILLVGISLAAPAASRGAGTSSVPFLRSETTARVSGMGGVAAALTDDAGALYFNPAGLPYAAENRGSFTTWNGLDDKSRYAFLSGIYNTGKYGVFDLSYLNYNSGTEDIFALDGTDSSVTLAKEYAVGLGWGHEVIKNVSVGGQLKYVSSELAEAYKDHTATFDAGILAKSPSGRYTAGAGIRNATGEMKYVSSGDPLPRTLYAGVSGKLDLPTGNLLAAADFEKPRDQTSGDGHLGFEYTIDKFAIRAGIKRVNNDTSFTAGAGVRLNWFGLDYSFEPAGNLDQPVHKFTINIMFGGSVNNGQAQSGAVSEAKPAYTNPAANIAAPAGLPEAPSAPL